MVDRPRGRPPHQPTDEMRETVEEMAGLGIVQTKIAGAVGLSVSTLKKYYQDALDNGKTRAIHKVGTALFAKAIAGNVHAQMFYLRCQAGWRENKGEDDSGSGGLQIVYSVAGEPSPPDPPRQHPQESDN